MANIVEGHPSQDVCEADSLGMVVSPDTTHTEDWELREKNINHHYFLKKN